MSGQWHHSSYNQLERAGGALAELWQVLARPARLRRLRHVLIAALMLWAIYSLSDLIWTLVPHAETTGIPDKPILNPVDTRQSAGSADAVDIAAMTAWSLFGNAAEQAADQPREPVVEPPDTREGIEEGARETRLDLKLRGAIASTEDGLGHAVIEHRSRQDVYAVGDKLPVGDAVTLAKVILGAVVLDNNGSYELLRLFEETTLLEQLPLASLRPRSGAGVDDSAKPAGRSRPRNKNTAAIAQNFRRQVYENPQSLAEVVRVSAVREDNVLKGYRVDPGKNSAQFSQLGFRAGDVVTSVNGISLDNPGNTMQLYQLMRSVSEAVFDVEREGQSITLTVSLDEASGEG